MTPDDAHSSHNHGFELPETPQVVLRNDARPWRVVAGVAVCLGLAGLVTGLVVAHRQTVSDAHLTSDALQREDLRDGWKALGAAAAHDAQTNGVQANSAAPAPAAPPNVVIVNVPAQSAAAAPPSVTNINLPSGSVQAAAAPTDTRSGYAPSQSLPTINYSPVTGYLPTQTGYTSTPGSDPAQPGYLPQNSYGATPGGAAPPVGNGSIPGSTSNPALANNGLVGSVPTPGQPNGPVNGSPTPSAPVGNVPSSPGTPSLPSGFSVP
ncbi:MAG: hypothetical protein WDO74_26295 [Pseudomonadota bacterium]